jgi:hypothetical protein
VAIGDIHGHHDRLVKLWDHLQRSIPDFDAYLVVFLGDYVNRGPKVRETLEFLVDLKARRPNTVFLMGNHDFKLAAFLGLLGPREPGSRWEHEAGGHSCNATFKSYGVGLNDRAAMLAAMPESHQAFLRDLALVHEIPGFIFVHGGLVPSRKAKYAVSKQLEQLKARSAVIAQDRPHQLFLHEDTYKPPASVVADGQCVVSGHQGFVDYCPGRIIVDNIGQSSDRALMCFVSPRFEIIDEDGVVAQKVPFSRVFPQAQDQDVAAIERKVASL